MFERPPLEQPTMSPEQPRVHELALMDYFIQHFGIIAGKEYVVRSVSQDIGPTAQPLSETGDHLYITTTKDGKEKIYPLSATKRQGIKPGDKVKFIGYPEKPNLASYFHF